ncbi:MAG TPA: phosphatidylglycerophosphatase A [bacterium]|nr:phosphatidylglycerophosphatase A [bacterium]
MRRLALCLSSGLGLGFIPGSPGTYGTLWGVLFFYLGRHWPWPQFAAGVAAFTLFAVLISQIAERATGSHDSSSIVIDEVAGYLVAVVFVPFSAKTALLSFIFFRLFDIAKPWPIRYIDKKWGGGWGVVMDDVLAGVFANLSLQLVMLIWGIS